jgi:hypothetical protein
VLQSRTYGVTSANSSLSKIAASLGAGATFVIPTPVGGTRGDVVVANAKGQFSIIQGVPGGAAATCPAGFTLLGTVSTTTGGVVTATATGPTS